ncbi:hypothetical protein JCM13304A_00560 [Desulfothermus okinawensis JCM 13304]
MFSSKKLGLALGEGGARGLVHIGILQVLKENDIKVDIIAGTSIGAIIGAMYCEEENPYEVESRFKDFISSDLYEDIGFINLERRGNRQPSFWDQIYSRVKGTIALTMAQTKLSILDNKKFKKIMEFLIKIKTFDQCKVPLVVVATDLIYGRDIPLCVGDLRKSVMASASVPGFFPPVKIGNHILSDGAIACPVPVKYARLNNDTTVVSVAVPPKLKPIEEIENAVELLIRAEEINMHHLTCEMVKSSDISIIPDIGDIEWNEFHHIESLVEIGRKAGKELIAKLHKKNRFIKRFF